jgi:transcriptional regulator with XRE-family HTH domain
MKRVGTRIRLERQKQKLTLAQLAKRVGINPVTLHRIETGKSSPSVALLSEIAQALNHPIVSLVQEIDKPLIHIKKKEQQTLSVAALKVKVVGPPKMIRDNIVVTYGELKKGKRIDAHSNPGIEWAYVIEGKCEHKQDDKSFILEAGDSISYDARVEHSVLALEKLKFIGIYVKEQDL